MNVEKLRSQVVDHIKSSYEETGKAPSVQKICDEIPGLNRSNFYKIFKGIGEACEMAGVPAPSKRIGRTRMASKKRIEEKSESTFNLTEEQYRAINAISYMENKPIHEVIDELIENHRTLKGYDISLKDTANLSNLLKRAEEKELKIDDVLKVLKRYTDRGLHYLGDYELNIFDGISDLMKLGNLNFDDLQILFKNKNELYRSGYEDCLEDARREIEKELIKSTYGLELFVVKGIVGNIVLKLSALLESKH